MSRDPNFTRKFAILVTKERLARLQMGRRLRVADWLGVHLPFRWIPGALGMWVNNTLARFMWSTPGFDVAEGCTCSGFWPHDKDCPEGNDHSPTGPRP